MKTIATLLVGAVGLLAGCSSIDPQVQSAIPFLEPGVALAASGYLLIDSKNRPADIVALQKVADTITNNPSGAVTDMAWLRQVLTQYFPDQSQYIGLIGGILDVAATIVPSLQSNSAELRQAMQAIAKGINDATALYTVKSLSKDKIKQQRKFWADEYSRRPEVMRRSAARHGGH
jgi:hypothetical protein